MLDRIEKDPAIRLTPEQHQQAVVQAGNALMREALQKLDHARQETERERQQLAGMIGSARTQDRQLRVQIWPCNRFSCISDLCSPSALRAR